MYKSNYLNNKHLPPAEMSFKLFGFEFKAKTWKAIDKYVPTAAKIAGLTVCTTLAIYAGKKLIDKCISKSDCNRKPTDIESDMVVDVKSPEEMEVKEDTLEAYPLCEVLNETSKHTLTPLIGNLLPVGSDCILYGPKGSMKSYLTLATLMQVSTGSEPDFLPPEERDYGVPKVHSIYVDGENGREVLAERMNSNDGAIFTAFTTVIPMNSFGCDLDMLFDKIKDVCHEKSEMNILLAIDNMKTVINENSKASIRSMFNHIRMLRQELSRRGQSLSTIVVCHTNKDNIKISGSHDVTCLTPYVFRIEPYHDGKFMFTVDYARSGGLKGSKYLLEVDEYPFKHLKFVKHLHSEDDGAPYSGKLSIAEAKKLLATYQPGVTGSGLKQMTKLFPQLTSSTEVSRELDKIRKYLETHPDV